MIETDYSFSQPPSVTEVGELLMRQEKLSFKLPANSYNDSFVKTLHDSFPDHVIGHIAWLGTFHISRVFPTSFVLQHLDGFLSCIKAFDQKAHAMMQLMADTFGIGISGPLDLKNLRDEDGKRRMYGNINEEWEYRFHGSACSFKNNQTGQFLDVYVIKAPEFGRLDTFYLLQFINTTPELAKWKNLLEDRTENLQKVINVLKYQNLLTVVPNSFSDEILVLNRSVI